MPRGPWVKICFSERARGDAAQARADGNRKPQAGGSDRVDCSAAGTGSRAARATVTPLRLLVR